MSISASQIVQVNPRILDAGGDDLDFNGLLLSQSEDIASGNVLAFADPDDISDYFGADSDEARLADVYFLGYTNSFTKPMSLYISRRIDSEIPAWIRGASLSIGLADLRKEVTAGISFEFSENSVSLENLDFSSIETWSDAALILQSALRAKADDDNNDDNSDESETSLLYTILANASVAYSSLYHAFKVESGLSGSLSTISYATEGTLAEMLCLTAETGATLSQGSDALSESENMDKILEVTQNWVNFTTTWLPTKDEVLSFADWTNDQGVAYLYLYSDTSPLLLQSNSTETIAYALKEANVSAVAGQYSDVDYSVFLMGVASCIDWDRIQGTITTAFKSQDGLSASVQNSSDALNLIEQGMNFIGDYATRNDNFVFNYPGQMFGTYSWIDTYWNAIWLNNALQVSLLTGLANSPRTPYSEQGYALVRAWMQDPVNRALKNGVIEAGVTLTESQKSQINREAGISISDEIYATGYYIQVQDPGATARINRDSPTVNLWYTYGGSINKLVVASTALV